MNQDAPFKTTDYGLAAYLVFHGMDLVGTEPTGQVSRAGQPQRCFLFLDDPKRPAYVAEWEEEAGKAEICRPYAKASAVVKRVLKDEGAQVERYSQPNS